MVGLQQDGINQRDAASERRIDARRTHRLQDQFAGFGREVPGIVRSLKANVRRWVDCRRLVRQVDRGRWRRRTISGRFVGDCFRGQQFSARDDGLLDVRLDDVFIEKSSGESLRYGKPHPEVYLNACDALSVEPQHCVAIEDSFVGLLAAKAAKMKTIVIPEHSLADQKHFVIADRLLGSLEELTPEILQSL